MVEKCMQEIRRLRDDLAQKKEELYREVEALNLYERAISGLNVPEISRVLFHRLYGTDFSFVWNETTAENALKVMAAFPPVMAGLVKHGDSTSFRMFSFAPPESEYRPTSGHIIHASKTGNYNSRISVDWHANLFGTPVRMRVYLEPIVGITPAISGEVRRDRFGKIKEIFSDRLEFPSGTGEAVTRIISYARVSADTWRDFMAWSDPGNDMAEVLRAVIREEERQRGELMVEYWNAKDSGLNPQPEVPYVGAQAGTKAQHACLNTIEARTDQTLARLHWAAYVAAHKGSVVNLRSSGFDYYRWACVWLEEHGLLEDSGYRYGSAWLNVGGEENE